MPIMRPLSRLLRLLIVGSSRHRHLCQCRRRHVHSFVTTPIFYVNAGPHIGHLYSALLADTAHRWALMTTATASDDRDRRLLIFSTGTDEHGIKIQNAAALANQSPGDFCTAVSDQFRSALDHFDVRPTDFIRTTEQRHRSAVESVWASYSGWYSVVDECFYAEQDVEEAPSEAGKPVKISKASKSRVEWTSEENYMFRLTALHDRLRTWLIDSDAIQPKHFLPLVLRMLRPDEDLSVSRDSRRLHWGIPVPDDPSQTVYVWLDALVNYLTVAGYPGPLKRWPPDCQIIGKDILKFHAIYWPAFLMALGLEPPKRLFVHSHWLVDGAKASEELTVEGLRYFLLRQGMPQDDANFTLSSVRSVFNTELGQTIGNLVNRGTVAKVNKEQLYPHFDRSCFDKQFSELGRPLLASIDRLLAAAGGAYSHLLIYQALEAVTAVARQANGFFQHTRPWALPTGGRERATALHVTYEAARVAALMLQPVVPAFADRALSRLGVPPEGRSTDAVRFLGEDAQRTLAGRPLGSDTGPLFTILAEPEKDDKK